MELSSMYVNCFGTYEQLIRLEDDGNFIKIKYNGEILYEGKAFRIEEGHYCTEFVDDKGEKRKFYHATFVTTG